MNPNTAKTLAALGMTPRAAPAGHVERVPAPRQTVYAADQLAAEIGSRLSGGVDGPAPKGDRPGQGLSFGWDAVVDAVVREAGGQPPGLASRSAGGVDGPAPKGGQSSAAGHDLWAAVAKAVVAEAGASNIGGQS